MDIRRVIENEFSKMLEENQSPVPTHFGDDLLLLQSGLDSLGFAVLITRLESEIGYDPFTIMNEPFYPKTFGQLVEVYQKFSILKS